MRHADEPTQRKVKNTGVMHREGLTATQVEAKRPRKQTKGGSRERNITHEDITKKTKQDSAKPQETILGRCLKTKRR